MFRNYGTKIPFLLISEVGSGCQNNARTANYWKNAAAGARYQG